MFSDTIAAAEKEYNLGKGDGKFKFQEGDNRIRVMSESPAMQSEYKGEKRVKFLTWVWDYTSNSLKLAFFPYTIAKKLATLEKDAEYRFNEIPMPYDLNIKVKDAGTKEVEYEVIPARSNSPVPQAALDALAKEKPIEEVRRMILDKQNAQASEVTTADGSSEELVDGEPPV